MLMEPANKRIIKFHLWLHLFNGTKLFPLTKRKKLQFIANMSKKKGLSFEEKRDRMLEVFYEHKDVYQLKDLEKICPKVREMQET